MRPASRLAAAAAVLALASGCGLFGKDTSYRPVNPAAVGLPVRTDQPLHVGLVVSPNAAAGEGREYASLAAGARVAEVRFARGGAKVTLDVEDDLGTAAGSEAAVRALVAKGVVGIVYASDGPHLAPGLRVAREAGVAVLLPYAGSLPDGTGDGAWLTGPSTTQVLDTLRNRLETERLGTPTVLAIGRPPDELASRLGDPAVTVLRSPAGVTQTSVRRDARAILVWASAADSALLVQRLQARQVTLPILLSQSALSADFAAGLAAAKDGAATAAGRYVTAGIPTTTETSDAAGFAAALRLTAADPSITAVTGNVPFATRGADTADGRSHDAVVALVAAADRAATHDAAGTLAALRDLRLDRGDGLVGPPLSFSGVEAVAQSDVVALQSSATPERDQLLWFALPSPEGSS